MTFIHCAIFDNQRKVVLLHFLAAPLLAVSLAVQVLGQTREWRNSSGGSYHTAANWTPADVPDTAAEIAIFNLDSSYAVTFNSGAAIGVSNVFVGDGRVVFQAPGLVTYTVSNQIDVIGSDFIVSESAAAGRIDVVTQTVFVTENGRFTLDGGSQSVIDSLYVGDTFANDIGEVRVQGGSSLRLRSGETLFLGRQTSGASRLSVTGTDSLLDAEFGNDIQIGSNGIGIMEVLSRGVVNAPVANVEIGQPAAGFGSRLTLNGDAKFTTFDPGNGYGFTSVQSTGTVEVLGGSLFEPGFLSVQSDSSVLVSGLGSILRTHGSLGLADTSSITVQSGARAELLAGGGSGIAGRASLTVTGAGTRLVGHDGITVTGDNPALPARVHVLNGAVIEPDTPGNVMEFLLGDGYSDMVVAGANSAYHSGGAQLSLATGPNSAASLRVNGGGTVTVGQLAVGTSASASGSIDLDAGTLVVSGPAQLSSDSGGAAIVNVLPSSLLEIDGQMTLGSSAVLNLFGGELRLADLAELTDQGGNVNWNNGTVRASGHATLTPAASGLLLPAGVLRFGQTMHVGGNLTLQATLVVDGGTLAVESLSNELLLTLKSGTFHWLDSELIVGASEPLGSILDLGPNLTVKVEGNITNNGVITGDGTLSGNLANQVSGTVRIEQGKSLAVTGGASHTNSGNLEMLGGRLDLSGNLANNAAGTIAGRGTLAVAGTWNNSGNAAFSAGFSDVFGNVANSGAGNIIVTGGATVTFYDDVVHNGAEIRTSAGSGTVFLGDVTGAGPFTGVGTNYFEGSVAPGNSASAVSFAGDVVLGATARLEIELGGTTPGTEFDVLDIAGTTTLGGMLDVTLINGFMPAAGDSFDILDWKSASGAFNVLNLPALRGLEWDISGFYTEGVLAVVAPGLPGDYNADGSVDAADYVTWRKNPDGFDGHAGYTTWRTNFGRTVGAASRTEQPGPPRLGGPTAGVPEPCTALLILLTAPLAMRRRFAS